MTLRRNSSSGQENKPFLGVCSGGRRAGGGRRGEPRWGHPPRRGGQGEVIRAYYEEAAAAELLRESSPGQPAPPPGESCRAVGGASRLLAAAARNWLGEAGCARAAAPGRGRAPPRGQRESRAAPGGRRGDPGSGDGTSQPPRRRLAPAPRLKPSQLRRVRAGTCFEGGISSSGQLHQRPRLAFRARELKAPALHQGHGDEKGALGLHGSRARAPTVRSGLFCLAFSTRWFFPSSKSKLHAKLLHGRRARTAHPKSTNSHPLLLVLPMAAGEACLQIAT